MKSTDSRVLDVAAKHIWDASYCLTKAETLWGEGAVPYVARAAEIFRTRKCLSVIDIPCGDGRNLKDLMISAPCVVGVDSSASALNIAAGAVRSQPERNCFLMEGDIFGMSCPAGQFDGVFCWDILGHLRNPDIALKELYRISRDDGVVVASFFSHGDSTKGVNMKSAGSENEFVFAEKYYFKFYNKEEVVALVKSCGFAVRDIELARWREPPHEGYREYEHDHESWVVILEKAGR